MSTINDGGPVFPSLYSSQDYSTGSTRGYQSEPGMTLRDYFAAKAMHALLTEDGTTNFPHRAIEAYQMADAMLAARERP